VVYVCLIATGILFEHLCQKDGRDLRRTHTSRLVLATTLFSLAVAFKLSTSVFALIAWCLVFREIWLLGRSSHQRTRYFFSAIALSTLTLLPWCIRGIILSGYPFYPATVFAFPGLEDPHLRRYVVRHRHSILRAHSRRPLSQHPGYPLARLLGESRPSKPIIVPSATGNFPCRSCRGSHSSVPQKNLIPRVLGFRFCYLQSSASFFGSQLPLTPDSLSSPSGPPPPPWVLGVLRASISSSTPHALILC